MTRLRAHYADTSGELYWHTEASGSCEPCGSEAARLDSVPQRCSQHFFFFFFCNSPTPLPLPPPPPSGWTCSRTLLANEDWQVYSLRQLKIDRTINFRLVLPFFLVSVCFFAILTTTKKQEMWFPVQMNLKLKSDLKLGRNSIPESGVLMAAVSHLLHY